MAKFTREEMMADLAAADAAGHTALANRIADEIRALNAPKGGMLEETTPEAIKSAGQRGFDTFTDVTAKTWNENVGRLGAEAQGQAWLQERGETAMNPYINAGLGALIGGPIAGAAAGLDAGAQVIEGLAKGTYNKITGQGGYTEAFEEARKHTTASDLVHKGIEGVSKVLPGVKEGLGAVAAPFAGISEATGAMGGPITQTFADLAMALAPFKPRGARASRNLPTVTPRTPEAAPAPSAQADAFKAAVEQTEKAPEKPLNGVLSDQVEMELPTAPQYGSPAARPLRAGPDGIPYREDISLALGKEERAAGGTPDLFESPLFDPEQARRDKVNAGLDELARQADERKAAEQESAWKLREKEKNEARRDAVRERVALEEAPDPDLPGYRRMWENLDEFEQQRPTPVEDALNRARSKERWDSRRSAEERARNEAFDEWKKSYPDTPQETLRKAFDELYTKMEESDKLWRDITAEEAWREAEGVRVRTPKAKKRHETAMERAFEVAYALESVMPSRIHKKQGGWVDLQEKIRSGRTPMKMGFIHPDLEERFDVAFATVEKLFPKLAKTPDNFVFFSAKELNERRLARVALEKKHPSALSTTLDAIVDRQFPNVTKIKKAYPDAWMWLQNEGRDGRRSSAGAAHWRDQAGDKSVSIFLNTDDYYTLGDVRQKRLRTLPEIGATIAHELTHAWQFWVKGSEYMKTDPKKNYWKQDSEISARNVEEHALQRIHDELFDRITKERDQKKTWEVPDTAWFLQEGQTKVSEAMFRKSLRKSLDRVSDWAAGNKQRGMIDPEVLNLKKLFDGWKLWYSKDGKGTEMSKHLFSIPDENTADFIARIGKIDKDMPYQVGLIPQTFRGTNTLIGDWTNNAKLTALHVLRRLEALKASKDFENMRFEGPWKGLRDAYGFQKVFHQRWNKDLFRKDIDILLWFEKNPDQWFDGENYHPTKEQLIAKGMDPARAKLWEEYQALWDEGYDSMAQAAELAGRHVPAKIPGWMPHTWNGPYSVQVIRQKPDGTLQHLWEVNAHTAKERDAKQALIQRIVDAQKDPSITVKPEDPTWSGQTLGTTLEALRHAGDRLESSKGFQALIEALELGMAKGLISSAMERSNPLKIGHELERVADKGEFGLKDKHLRDAFINLQHNIEALHGWKQRVQFVTKTLQPLDSAGFLDHPNLRKSIMDYVTAEFGGAEPLMKKWDEALRAFTVGRGWDPMLWNKVSSFINNSFAKFYLLGNFSFYTVNGFQPFLVLPVLQNIKAQTMMLGEQTGSITRALANYEKNGIKGQKSHADYIWAEQRGLLTAVQAEMLDTTRLVDPLAKAQEHWARTQAYMLAVEYFKQMMPLEAARNAGIEAMKKAQVDYSALGQATMLSKFPLLGRPMVMFASFGQHMLGLYGELARTMWESSKQKNLPAAANAALAGAQFTGMMYALWGMTGLPFAQNWNDIAKAVNDFANETIFPTTDRLARHMDNALGLGTLSQFGLVSSLLGSDISGSAQGAGVQLPGAGARGVASFITLLGLSGKTLLGKATKQDWYEFLQKAPPQYRAFSEWMRAHPETTPQQHRLDKGRPRTLADTIKAKALGIRSIEESAAKITDRLVKEDETHIRDQFNSIVQKVKDNGGRWTPEHIKKLTELAKQYEQDPSSVIGEAQSWTEGKDLSPDMKKALRARSINQITAYQRWKKEQSREPQRIAP